MESRKLTLVFCTTSILLLTVFYGFFYIVDPMNVIQSRDNRTIFLRGNMRLLSKGMIDGLHYDSIILGTSMLENTSSVEAGNILDGNFINTSLSDSDFYERSILLDYILKKKPLEKVIYSLDYAGLIDNRQGNPSYHILSFDYLYDDNALNDFKVYVSYEGVKHTVKPIICIVSKRMCDRWKCDNDRPASWYKDPEHSSRFGGLNNWLEAQNNAQMKNVLKEILAKTEKIEAGDIFINKTVDKKIVNSEKYLNEHVIHYAKKYPNTEFILVIPPYSRLQNAINAQHDTSRFMRVKSSISYLVNMSHKFKNIKVYGWGDTNYPDDIANYKDLGHYHHNFNSLMLTYIKENKGLLTKSNIDQYLDDFTEKSLNYDVISIGNKIKDYLHKQESK